MFRHHSNTYTEGGLCLFYVPSSLGHNVVFRNVQRSSERRFVAAPLAVSGRLYLMDIQSQFGSWCLSGFQLLTACFCVHSDELRKEARQLKKELQAIKQRKEERLKPKEEETKDG